ncbi:MAG: hypothetical protein QS748_14705, partial [Candidatus Endonucleobacter bathymodioli]|nr:hypothetical protein [Candidatus Endonucleobacter bathymodioli]
MLDDNSLSDNLKTFEGKNSFEVLAMLYVYIVLGVDKLDNDMSKAELEVPAWIINFRPIAQEIKDKSGFCHAKSEVIKFELLTREEQYKVANEFNSRAKQYSTALKVLCPCQVQADASSLCIADELNKQVSLLISVEKSNNNFFITEDLPKIGALLNDLLLTYVVSSINNVPSEPQYPVLEALVRWSVHNEDSLISKLLENSKRWVTQKHHVAAEGNKEHSINKEDQVFFSYLNYNSKDKWHNANKALRDYETREITNTLLASDIIKSLIDKFKTVTQLAAAYRYGFEALDVVHSDRIPQEDLSFEQKITNKKLAEKGAVSKEARGKSITENIKDSLFAKLASSTYYAFNVVKSCFVATLTKQEQSKKVMADWIKMVQKNALNLKDNSENKGINLVMDELIKIDNIHNGDITIADALTTLVAQHCTSAYQEQAFTLLTGLQRKTDIR